MDTIKSAVSHLEGQSGYTCVAGKGHLDNCKDPNGVCETNSICRFIDDIKRRGKLDKTDIAYTEANNIENGANAKSSFELLFKLDYDIANGQRVNLTLLSPTVYEMDTDKYKYNKILKMLHDVLSNFVDERQKFSLTNPYEVYSLISEIMFKNKKKLYRLKTELAKRFSPFVLNSVKDQIDHILKNSVEKPFNKTLIIDNINDDKIYTVIKSFIGNIKNDLIREYKSPNRHIIPPLNPSFVASVDKQDHVYEIDYPNTFYGGKKHKKNQKNMITRDRKKRIVRGNGRTRRAKK